MIALSPTTPQPDSPESNHDAKDAWVFAQRYFLAPLLPFLADPTITEIMVNGPDCVFVERRGRVERTTAQFASDADLLAAARNIAQFVGRRIGPESPVLDGRLPDGSRVCVVVAPIATHAASFTIRKFSASLLSLADLARGGAGTPEVFEFLELAVAAHHNIIVSGGTGSGKTTLVNALASCFNDHERIITIEDTRELQIMKPHVVALEARPADRHGRHAVSIRDLFIASLRMRPDRIIVGEVRRGEALDMVQALTSGHRGCLSTLHANTPADACRRLETMAMLAEVAITPAALRRQIASAIDLIVQTGRRPDASRCITHVSEVEFDDGRDVVRVHDIFATTPHEPHTLAWTGRSSRLGADVRALGLDSHARHARRALALDADVPTPAVGTISHID
jgi:pilus assembly protein CpaF